MLQQHFLIFLTQTYNYPLKGFYGSNTSKIVLWIFSSIAKFDYILNGVLWIETFHAKRHYQQANQPLKKI